LNRRKTERKSAVSEAMSLSQLSKNYDASVFARMSDERKFKITNKNL